MTGGHYNVRGRARQCAALLRWRQRAGMLLLRQLRDMDDPDGAPFEIGRDIAIIARELAQDAPNLGIIVGQPQTVGDAIFGRRRIYILVRYKTAFSSQFAPIYRGAPRVKGR